MIVKESGERKEMGVREIERKKVIVTVVQVLKNEWTRKVRPIYG